MTVLLEWGSARMNSRFAALALVAVIAAGSATAKVYFEEKFNGMHCDSLIIWFIPPLIPIEIALL